MKNEQLPLCLAKQRSLYTPPYFLQLAHVGLFFWLFDFPSFPPRGGTSSGAELVVGGKITGLTLDDRGYVFIYCWFGK